MDRIRETRMLNSLERIAVALEKIAGIEPASQGAEAQVAEAEPETKTTKKDGDKK